MPTATPKHADLATAIRALQANLPTVRKDQTADTGKYSYTYANLASLMGALTPVLHENGLTWVSVPQRTEDGSYELVGTLRHESGESLSGSLPLIGRTPQEIGSAITYARRYLLGTVAGLVTEDDDDGHRAQQSQGRTRGETPPPPESPEQMLSRYRAAAWDVYFKRTPNGSQQAFCDLYEQWSAQPFGDAGWQDFDRFRSYLETAEEASA